ncbi:MAG: hypothetical protein IJA80_02195 [Clostridia bacterium]|nr:hypothetical protein [Clostridia bacterium]
MAKSKAPLTPEQAEIKKMKKEKASSGFTSFLAVVLAVALAVGVVSIGKTTAQKGVENAGSNVIVNNNGDFVNTDNSVSDDNTTNMGTDSITDENLDTDIESGDVTQDDNNQEETKEPERELPKNPAEWTKAEIVNYYKMAANNSTGVKSIQKMTMDNGMDVNLNNGALEFLIGLAEPIIKAALKANSTEFDGITGGYNDLVPSDIKSAKAYKEGNYTIIEMTPVEQTDDAYGDTFKGTTGHAISVVGNIAVVADNFPNWTINFKDAFVQLKYINPQLKVKINDKGVIEKGTWSYVVGVTVRGLQIEKVVVENATTEINYVITTGGGF